jgi:cysteine synthase
MEPASASILEAIGKTPLVQLRHIVPANAARVFVKLEYFHPTGAYKDGMALAIIENAERRSTLKPGMRVVEYTGGSTGSSLAHGLRREGLPIHSCFLRRLRQRKARHHAGVRWRLDSIGDRHYWLSQGASYAGLQKAHATSKEELSA